MFILVWVADESIAYREMPIFASWPAYSVNPKIFDFPITIILGIHLGQSNFSILI